MKRSFKPQVETLESRWMMDAAGMDALSHDNVEPESPVSGRITAIAVDPTLPTSQSLTSEPDHSAHPVAVLAWARVDGSSSTPLLHMPLTANENPKSEAADDVWVDGKIITAENFDSVLDAMSDLSVEAERYATQHEVGHLLGISHTLEAAPAKPTSSGGIVFVGGWGSSMYQY